MLSAHEQHVLAILDSENWRGQYSLRSSKRTMNKLVRLGLVEARLTDGWACHIPEYGLQYRLLNKD